MEMARFWVSRIWDQFPAIKLHGGLIVSDFNLDGRLDLIATGRLLQPTLAEAFLASNNASFVGQTYYFVPYTNTINNLTSINLSLEPGGTIIDINGSVGLIAVNDPAGLTINSPDGNVTITLSTSAGSPLPLPNFLHLNGTFTIIGLQGANPFANTQIEIAQSTLYFTYAPGQSPATAIQQALRTGYNSGAWNGSSSGPTGAITSNIAAAAPPSTFTIGYADSIDGIVTGQPANTVEVRYTVVADANLDRTVNVTDALLMARHYLLPITNPAWDIGNFNYDAAVDYSDALLLQKNWNTAAPAIEAASISDFIPAPVVTTPSKSPAISIASTPPPPSKHHQPPTPRKQDRSHPR